jgi:hypothetical protein
MVKSTVFWDVAPSGVALYNSYRCKNLEFGMLELNIPFSSHSVRHFPHIHSNLRTVWTRVNLTTRRSHAYTPLHSGRVDYCKTFMADSVLIVPSTDIKRTSKLFQWLIKQHAMKAYEGVEVWCHVFLTSTLDEGELLA